MVTLFRWTELGGRDGKGCLPWVTSTLTQTVGAAVLRFTTAKWFVFSISISWKGKEARPKTSSHGLDLTPHTGFTLYLLRYLVYVSQLPMDILGQVTKQGDRTLM